MKVVAKDRGRQMNVIKGLFIVVMHIAIIGLFVRNTLILFSLRKKDLPSNHKTSIQCWYIFGGIIYFLHFFVYTRSINEIGRAHV